MLANASNTILSVVCFTFPSFDNLNNFILDTSSILDAQTIVWIGVLSAFLVSLLALIIVLVERRKLDNSLKSMAVQEVSMTEFPHELVAPLINPSQADRISSKDLGIMQRFSLLGSGIGNSRIVQIPRTIFIRVLIRLRGWLDRLLGLFTRLLQFFSSFAHGLGFKPIASNRFLDSSDARTLGDINYMTTPKRIKRTFAKTKSNPEGKSEVQFISALQKTVALDKSVSISASKPQIPSVSIPVNSNRRTRDRSLEPFRNMARQIQSNPLRQK